MVSEYKARVRIKRDTDANWTTTNPVLLEGEMVAVRMADGSVRTKVGNGNDAYNNLPFNSGEQIIESELNAMLKEVLV